MNFWTTVFADSESFLSFLFPPAKVELKWNPWVVGGDWGLPTSTREAPFLTLGVEVTQGDSPSWWE